jgi:hypothetical protein
MPGKMPLVLMSGVLVVALDVSGELLGGGIGWTCCSVVSDTLEMLNTDAHHHCPTTWPDLD